MSDRQRASVLHRRLRRLALDVHDGPMQSVVAVALVLRAMQRRLLGEGDHRWAEQVGLMVAELQGIEQSLRSLITNLEHDGGPELRPLTAIAAGEAERFAKRSPAVVSIDAPTGVYPDSHSQEIALQSVLREALSNIAKHAGADHVDIRLEIDAAATTLTVRDDGRGFDLARAAHHRLGLRGMHERVELLGGRLRLDSHPGGPTTVQALIPRWQPLCKRAATRSTRPGRSSASTSS